VSFFVSERRGDGVKKIRCKEKLAKRNISSEEGK